MFPELVGSDGNDPQVGCTYHRNGGALSFLVITWCFLAACSFHWTIYCLGVDNRNEVHPCTDRVEYLRGNWTVFFYIYICDDNIVTTIDEGMCGADVATKKRNIKYKKGNSFRSIS